MQNISVSYKHISCVTIRTSEIKKHAYKCNRMHHFHPQIKIRIFFGGGEGWALPDQTLPPSRPVVVQLIIITFRNIFTRNILYFRRMLKDHYTEWSGKIAQSLMHRHFVIICNRITRFTEML